MLDDEALEPLHIIRQCADVEHPWIIRAALPHARVIRSNCLIARTQLRRIMGLLRRLVSGTAHRRLGCHLGACGASRSPPEASSVGPRSAQKTDWMTGPSAPARRVRRSRG